MISEFFESITQAVRGWWLVLADNPWLALGGAILAVLLLPLIGFGVGRLMRPRPAPVIAGDKAGAQALAAAKVEGERHRGAADAAREALAAAQRQQKAAETARDAAEAARAKAVAGSEDVRGRLAAAEEARKKAEAALSGVQTGAREAEAARAALADQLAAMTERAGKAESALEALHDKAAADLAAAEARAEAAAKGAAEAAADARAAAEKAIAEAQARAAEQISAFRGKADTEIAAALAEAASSRDAAAAAQAEAERTQAALDAASDGPLREVAARAEAGVAPMIEAQAAATAFLDMHAAGVGTALRMQALGALDGTPEGLALARSCLDVVRAFASATDGAAAEDEAVLAGTLAAALNNPAAAGDPAKAEAAGLPRLAEALWRNRAEAADDGRALASAAEAALWAGRWPQAAALAARAVALLGAQGEPADILSARLTEVQAVLFSGAPGAVALAGSLVDDAVAALGDRTPLVFDARRLHARALFEAGERAEAEDVVALLQGGPIDPTVDPVLRTARARGLQVSGDAEAAGRLFEALARQAGEGKRAGLGHRLDAFEASLAAAEAGEAVLSGLDALKEKVRTAFGERHPRFAQWALLRALALADHGAVAESQSSLAMAERLFAPRLDPAHRWRVAAAELAARLADMPTDGATASAPMVETEAEAPAAGDAEDALDGQRGDDAADRPEPTPVDEVEATETPTRPGPWGAYGDAGASQERK